MGGEKKRGVDFVQENQKKAKRENDVFLGEEEEDGWTRVNKESVGNERR